MRQFQVGPVHALKQPLFQFLTAAWHYKLILKNGLSQAITSSFSDQTPLKSRKAEKRRCFELPVIILVIETAYSALQGRAVETGMERDISIK